MSISYDASTRVFNLQANQTSYMIKILDGGYLAHFYWGRKLRRQTQDLRYFDHPSFSPTPEGSDGRFTLDMNPTEYPAYGNGDLRVPAYQIQLENGSTISDLRYESHTITPGKPRLEGLPATYTEKDSEAETLEITLRDVVTGLKVVLSYTAFVQYDAIARSVRFVNEGQAPLKLLRVLSASVDFPHNRFDMLDLAGSWSRERHVQVRPLMMGMQSVESRRGSSSHQHNPFLAMLSKDATEDNGDVYGFNLVYSGNFIAQAEVDQFNNTRVSIGMNPFDFSWHLEPGEAFQTPEAVLVYSAKGLGGMSRTYHKLYRSRICRGLFRDEPRPVLVNNWEATYFDFTAEKIEAIAEVGKELGIELFVLDDGWFGKRDNDQSSLGDWFVNRKKLPDGLEDLVERVHKLDMQFGIWFEPEMISPDSDLYRSHPDWCLHVPDRGRSLGRNQLILDFSRQDVCDEIIQMLSDILNNAPISYVKWDMNRNMSEIGSAMLPPHRQRETAHRYILGLYYVLETITTKFSHVLFESCSGGGGRFDPGMLYYMPQTWTSDNTDAVERLKIQYGTSIVYPISAMGAHVSAAPNHQVGRLTSLKTRGDIAMSGNFGYELDLSKFTDEEKELAKQQVALYKEIRSLVQFGDYYRLLNPFESNEAAWMFVSEDQSEAIVVYSRVLAVPFEPFDSLRLKGLDAGADYVVVETGQQLGGDELMYNGIHTPRLHGDFQSWLFRLKRVN
ncbi:alpha-galactosidase [Paenibacillus etheri]|uniref:Alpha-galactosidase n=1 Tax=Paenibacillus etheri TaxID=1306852 RepID=A0A0W1ATN9_9BACL|nr:alpha-galactosidase [Paenibacillus etheri]KTD84713.1 alpha-galactosidase [Paenibacillus etheri]